ncbi:MAG: translation initiation factor IF-2 [Clostridia bacterium]|nr:translation initiation factor IF-2 [Clostridia bacterium]
MSLYQKYRIREMGKDFNMKPQDIMSLLEARFGEAPANQQAVLTADQLNYLFDYFIQKNQIPSLALYFQAYQGQEPYAVKQRRAKQEREAKEAEERKKAEEAAAKEEARRQAEAAKKKAEADAARKAAEEAQKQKEMEAKKAEAAAKKAEEEAAKKAAADARRQQQTKKPASKRDNLKRVEFPAKKEDAKGSVNIVSGEDNRSGYGRDVMVVDTRNAADFNQAKYDSRLDDIVGNRGNRDYGKSKQKINKKNNKKQNFRSKKEDEQAKLKRMEQYEKDKKKHLSNVVLPESLSVSELSAKLRTTNVEVVKKLMELGIMASASQIIDYDTAALVAEELGAKVSKEVVITIEEQLFNDHEDEASELETRPPVVVVMGHVDHGKTSLLDAIRNTNVTAGEAGGITQHIGAYSIHVNDHDITFLDTPGHAAFTAMRARGAMVTDVAIIVVAADDGIMPQTVEAINHAKAANVPIIVAVNKMDKPTANYDRVLQALTEYELVPEEWGGDTICVPVSAVKHEGIDQLLEMILLVSEVADLKANPNREAKGTVIEAKLDKGRDPVASVLISNGTLHAGDVLVAGASVGRVRVMTNDKGMRIKEAGPSTPVEIIGLSDVPAAGDQFEVVKDEKMARELVEKRKFERKQETFQDRAKVSLDELFSQIQTGDVKTLNLIVKADVQGSVEAVRSSLLKLSNDEVKVKVIHNAVGAITESDVMLAQASNAIIIGFNVRPDGNVRSQAEKEKVDIRLYRIIYDCLEEMEAAMKGMLAPKFTENLLGHAEVRQTFRVSGVGTICGCYVKDGKIVRTASVRLIRDGIVVYEGKIDSLKRFKDDAKEVAEGFECGIGLDKFNDVKEGDVIEAYLMEEVKN